MIEIGELKCIQCVGDDGRPLTILNYQLFEMLDTGRGLRRRPGAVRLELATGEALRQVDQGCFEVIETGELVTIDQRAGVTGATEQATPKIALCRYEELAHLENRLRQGEQAKKR